MTQHGRVTCGIMLGFVCSLVAVGCAPIRDADSEDPVAPTLVTVRTAVLSEREMPSTLAAPGQWRAANEVVVIAPFAAVVESLGPRVGDRVQAGSTIGVLVTRESRAALRGAELMLRQASDATGNEEAARAIRQARQDLVRVPLVAGTSGLVVRRAADAGAEVAEGAELLGLVPARAIVFEAHVSTGDARRVVAGMPAVVAMEGGSPIRASVQRRLPTTSAADQSALIWLSPLGDAPAGALERFGVASIEIGAPRRVLAVPDSALVEDDLTGEVRLARVDPDGSAHWVVVRVGAAAAGWHELLDPRLPPGTLVIIQGQRGLPDSARVRVFH